MLFFGGGGASMQINSYSLIKISTIIGSYTLKKAGVTAICGHLYCKCKKICATYWNNTASCNSCWLFLPSGSTATIVNSSEHARYVPSLKWILCLLMFKDLRYSLSCLGVKLLPLTSCNGQITMILILYLSTVQ